MAKKDFSILFEKISNTSGSKDIAMVSGYNSYAQQIEVVCKTQKGELVSDMNLGSNFYTYAFNGGTNQGLLESSLAAYIQAAIKTILNVKVKLQYFSENNFQFIVSYSVSDGISKTTAASAFVEVEL